MLIMLASGSLYVDAAYAYAYHYYGTNRSYVEYSSSKCSGSHLEIKLGEDVMMSSTKPELWCEVIS